MFSERELTLESFIEVAHKKPEQFSRGCDSLVDYQISPETLDNITQALDNGRNVALITNHQSYFEIETQRYFCSQVNQSLGGKLQSFLLYSAPAVARNIGPLLQLRNKTYSESGLNMLGIIRDIDTTHPLYQFSIDEKMKKQNRDSRRTFAQVISGQGYLIIYPFEASLKGGRTNPETGKINGMQLVDESCLDIFIKRNFLLLPCGIDGSYNLINPQKQLPSNKLIQAITATHSEEKVVTFRVGDFIDPASQIELGFNSKQVCHDAIVQVAKLISPEAQGVYSQYVST